MNSIRLRSSSPESCSSGSSAALPVGNIVNNLHDSRPRPIRYSFSSGSCGRLRLLTQVTTSNSISSESITILMARDAFSNDPGRPLIQSWTSPSPSRLMVMARRPLARRLRYRSGVRASPLVTIPQGKPCSYIARPQASRSFLTRGSPPVILIITLCGSYSLATESRALQKSSTGISFTRDWTRQSLPQCLHDRLQRNVHSQNNWRNSCLLTASSWSLLTMSSAILRLSERGSMCDDSYSLNPWIRKPCIKRSDKSSPCLSSSGCFRLVCRPGHCGRSSRCSRLPFPTSQGKPGFLPGLHRPYP